MIFKPARIENVPKFMLNLRDEDREEMRAVHGNDFAKGLRAALAGALGYQCWEGWSEAGEPQAIFGISAPHEAGSQVFMVGSASLVADRRWFLGTSSQIIGEWLSHRRRSGGLYCWVDARNLKHVRYLRHLGFEIAETDPHHGRAKLPFHRMTHV